MTHLVQPDQTGFIPTRNTAINIRRFRALMEDLEMHGEAEVVPAVDMEKAFDSLE